MEEDKSSSIHVVTNPEVADILTDPEASQLLTPFFSRALTIAEAARETSSNPNTMYARVRRFVRLGLLVVEREVPRSGRALKLYRCAAERFFVPFEVMSFESLESMLRKLDTFWEHELRRAVTQARREAVGNWGYQIYLDEQGGLSTNTSLGPMAEYDASKAREPAVLSLWDDGLRLDFEDAKALQQELLDLYRRYAAKSGAQGYLLRLGLAARTGRVSTVTTSPETNQSG